MYAYNWITARLHPHPLHKKIHKLKLSSTDPLLDLHTARVHFFRCSVHCVASRRDRNTIWNQFGTQHLHSNDSFWMQRGTANHTEKKAVFILFGYSNWHGWSWKGGLRCVCCFCNCSLVCCSKLFIPGVHTQAVENQFHQCSVSTTTTSFFLLYQLFVHCSMANEKSTEYYESDFCQHPLDPPSPNTQCWFFHLE